MKIYLAGSCSQDKRHRMEDIAKELRSHGYEVYCPFELKIPNAWNYSQEDWAFQVFHEDITALDACDFVVMISDGHMSSAGTNWEQGYAYAKGKDVFVFQWENCNTSIMTYRGCRYFANLTDFAGAANWVGEFPYEIYMENKNFGSNPCKTILT